MSSTPDQKQKTATTNKDNIPTKIETSAMTTITTTTTQNKNKKKKKKTSDVSINANTNKSTKKKKFEVEAEYSMSNERLKAYGLNPKKLKKKFFNEK